MDDYELLLAIEESKKFYDIMMQGQNEQAEQAELQRILEESRESYYQQQKNKVTTIINKTKKSINEKLFSIGFSKLNDFQKNIFYECIDRNSSGLSLPLGTGKTIISIVLGLYFTVNKNAKPILIVASKSLITNWAFEIKKFFGDELKYEIVHKSFNDTNINSWKIKTDTKLILITADLLAIIYKSHNIDKEFVNQQFDRHHGNYINEYIIPTKPFINHVLGGGYFYSIVWGCYIVDEIQKYTNIETMWCRSMGAICSNHRWLLSGTMFDEPKINRILGYYTILNVKGKPRTLPEMQKLVTSKNFKGLSETIISRDKNNAFVPPKVNEHIITHELSNEEKKIYIMMKKILIEIRNQAEKAKLYDNIEDLKKFNSYKLVMIMYLRQTLICPLLPITSVSLKICDMKQKSELSTIIVDELKKNNLDKWVDTIESAKSSRIQKVIECAEKHNQEKIIVFGCFKSFLDILQHYVLELKRPLFVMTSVMSMKKRQLLLKEFEKSKNGILLITYQLGAEGLNLQFATTVMLIDFWWNASKIQQAIGRIFRYGQLASEINVYFFTSNTGIEKILFLKQKAKLHILNELKTGMSKTKIPGIKMDNIIKLIEISDNEKLLKDIKFY